MNPAYITNVEIMKMPGRPQKFSNIYPQDRINPEVRVGVWVTFDGSDGDWFVTAMFNDIAQLKTAGIMNAEEIEIEGETVDQKFARVAQAGRIRAKRTGDLTIVGW
jgi:hypothetical protein